MVLETQAITALLVEQEIMVEQAEQVVLEIKVEQAVQETQVTTGKMAVQHSTLIQYQI